MATKWTPEEIEQMEIDQELDDCRASCAHFIQAWVHIEDKDEALGDNAPGVKIKFILWKLQLQALIAILSNRLLILLKARQLGCTWLALSYAVWRMVFFPGFTVAGVSKTEKEAKELIRRIEVILRALPDWMIREKTPKNKKSLVNFNGPIWTSTTETITITHPNKETSAFHAFTSAPSSGRSFTENLVILDEWAHQQWAEEIWSGIYPTVNRPTGGQVIGLSSNKRGSFFEAICKKPEDYGFIRIFLPWRTDPRRTHDWHEKTKKAMPNSWRQEYPSTPEEAMSAGEGTAFPEFTQSIHVCKPFKIPHWWRRWRGNDPGYADPFYHCWFAVSDEGIVYLYREYTRTEKDPRVTYSEQAREVVRKSVQGGEVGSPDKDESGKPISERISFTCVGRDAWNRTGRGYMAENPKPSDGKSIIDCYTEGGLTGCIEPPRDTKTDRILQKAVFHEYLDPFYDERQERTISKLQIFSTCTALIEAIPELVNDEKDNEKVSEDPHVYTNPFKGAVYGLIAWHKKRSEPPKEEKTRVQLDKERLAKGLKGPKQRRRLA
jgi:hypothetical protein